MLLAAAVVFASAGFVDFPPSEEIGAMSGVAVDGKSGNTYVLHRGPKPVMKFDKNGKFVKSWGAGMFKVAHGLRVDKSGNVWTTDNGNHKIRKFSQEGELIQTLDEGFKSPDDLVFGKDGSIYVADAGNARIVKLTPDGKINKAWGKKGKGNGEFALAHGLAIDSEDRIYVADRGNHRVQVFTPDGGFVAAWSGFGNPFGVLVHKDDLLVSEGETHEIIHLGLVSGGVKTRWGGPGTLQLPHIMSLDKKGRLLVAEVNGKRVQIFKPGK